MKVVDVVAHVLSSPLEEPFAFSQGWVEERNAMVVEVCGSYLDSDITSLPPVSPILPRDSSAPMLPDPAHPRQTHESGVDGEDQER